MTKAGTLAAVTLAVLGTAPAHAQSTGERSAPAASASTSGRSCESLASLALPHAKVTSSERVAAGAFKVPNAGRGAALFAQLPAFCRVAATLTPSPDSQIQMEIWLPAENWNGKFLAVGNGGWAGNDLIGCDCGRSSPRIRSSLERHRSLRRGRPVRAQSGQVDRLRLSRDARDDRAVEDDRRRVLQPSAPPLVLPGLLDWWAAGDDGGAALSRRLRRDRCRCAGLQHGPSQRVADGVAGAHVEEPRAHRPAEQGDARRERRNRRMRRERRRQGQHHQRPARVQVRSRHAGLQGW